MLQDRGAWAVTPHKVQGFTLIELMIVLVIAAVLLAAGAPSFANLIKNNRMLSLIYEMRATVNTARSEALTQRTFVTVCSSKDGATCGGEWKEGYIAFRDTDGDGTVDNPNTADGDQIILAKTLDVDTKKFSYSSLPDHRIRFDSRGYATGFSGTFTLCDDRGQAEARGLILTPSGLLRAAEDPIKKGVMLDHEGDALDCT